MTRKFRVGDLARVAPPRTTALFHYRTPVRPGRVVHIVEVLPATHCQKCYYRIGTNHKRGELWLRSDDLRALGEPQLRGRTGKSPGGPQSGGQGVYLVSLSPSPPKEPDLLLQWIEARGALIETTGCVLWTGTKNAQGYGTISYRGSTQKVHRVVNELLGGPIPKGIVVRHMCDEPSCFQPNHLARGTHADNMRDARLKWGRKVDYNAAS